jgi:type II secretory ATPase GspE/PulE/Tfp pilus assembly ATPase PilB-like protein
MLIAELVRLDSPLRKAILTRTDSDEIKQVLNSKGQASMVEDGHRLVADGLTTQDELDKVCGSAGDI